MAEWIYELFIYILDITKILIVGRNILGIKITKNRKIWYLSLTFLGIGSFIHNFLNQSKYVIICYTLTLILVSIHSLEARKFRIIVLSLILIFLITSVDTIAVIFFGFIQRNNIWNESKLIAIVGSSVTLLFCYIIGLIFRRNKITFPKPIKIGEYIFLLGVIWLNITISSYLLDFILRVQWEGNQIVLYGAFVAMTLSVYFQIGMIIYLEASRNYHKECNELSKEYLKAQRQHFNYLKDKETATMKLRHDFKNHLYIVGKLVDSGNAKELVQYINKLNECVIEARFEVDTHNEVVNAIINKYYDDAIKLGAKLEIQGHMPSECFVDSFDLCIIFSNILSNALEAVKKCENKTIKVQIRYDKEQIFILEENNYTEEITQKEGRFFTCKKNKDNHGFGIENIMESVKKYNGLSSVEYKENNFKILIAIPN